MVLRINSYIGLQVDVHSTALGKVMIAWLPKNVQTALINNVKFSRFTANTITSKTGFIKELQTVRLQKYAEDNEEIEKHLCCIAVPIFNAKNYPCAAISASIPTVRFSKDKKQKVLIHLYKCAKILSKSQGNKDYQKNLEGTIA